MENTDHELSSQKEPHISCLLASHEVYIVLDINILEEI